MQERGSDKHGPRVDDQMEKEVEGAMRARRPTRAQEERETEPMVTDEGEPVTDPDVEKGPEASEETEEREETGER